MKSKYLIIATAIVAVLAGCSRDEESLFDRSAAQRINDALVNSEDKLVSATNGWDMLYFANPRSEGYHIILKFNGDSHVSATAKNALTTGNKMVTDTASLWEVIYDYGPILTFNTYNKVFHAWSDPQEDGEGYQGDYEFLILKSDDPDIVRLKGKKRSAYCTMYRIADGETQESIFAETETVHQQLFANNNILRYKDGDVVYTLHDGKSGVFTITANGQAKGDDDNVIPLIATKNGIHLMTNISGEGGKNYVFTLKDNALVSETATISPNESLVEYMEYYMRLTTGTWSNVPTACSEEMAGIYNTITEALKALSSKAKKNAEVKGFNITWNVEANTEWKAGEDCTLNVQIPFTLENKTTTLNLNLIYKATLDYANDQIKLTYVNAKDQSTENYLTKVPAFMTLVNAISSTFKTTTSNAFNPTNGIVATNTEKNTVYFTLTGSVK